MIHRDFYSDPVHRKRLDVDVDISKYVASGICIFELRSGLLKHQIRTLSCHFIHSYL